MKSDELLVLVMIIFSTKPHFVFGASHHLFYIGGISSAAFPTRLN